MLPQSRAVTGSFHNGLHITFLPVKLQNSPYVCDVCLEVSTSIYSKCFHQAEGCEWDFLVIFKLLVTLSKDSYIWSACQFLLSYIYIFYAYFSAVSCIFNDVDKLLVLQLTFGWVFLTIKNVKFYRSQICLSPYFWFSHLNYDSLPTMFI